MTSAIELCPTQPLLTVGGVTWGPLADEATNVLDQPVTGSKAPHTEGEKDPASGVRGLGRILCQLLADVAVDLISGGRGRGRGGVSD